MSAMEIDRRSGSDRRKTTFAAYWHGARNPRRRGGRRASDLHYPVVDWHSPRLLIPVFTILALCVLDGLLTVTLMCHGLRDPMIAAAIGKASRDQLVSLGYTVEWQSYPMEHQVCMSRCR